MDKTLLKKLAVHYIAPFVALPPTSVFVNPTLKCSSKCAHCGVWRADDKIEELTAEQWGRILSDRFLRGVTAIWFSGGEPTLRSDLGEIALEAVSGMPALQSVTVATNGLHPSRLQTYFDETIAKFAARKIYSWTHFSLDGDREIHDKVRGVTGAYNSLERCIAILKKQKSGGANAGWGFNCVISPKNAEHLAGAEAAAERFGGEITFNIAFSSGGFYRSDAGVELDENQKRAAREFIEKLTGRTNPYYRRHYETVLDILSGKSRIHKCETMEATLYLDADGFAYPCPAAYEFRAPTYPAGVRNAWHRIARYRQWIRKNNCARCALGCSFGEGVSLTEFFKLARNV